MSSSVFQATLSERYQPLPSASVGREGRPLYLTKFAISIDSPSVFNHCSTELRNEKIPHAYRKQRDKFMRPIEKDVLMERLSGEEMFAQVCALPDIRFDDGGDVNAKNRLSIFTHLGRPLGQGIRRYLSDYEYNAAEIYVLMNYEDVAPYIEKFDDEIQKARPTIGEDELQIIREKKFASWFRQYMLSALLTIIAPLDGLDVECTLDGGKMVTRGRGRKNKTPVRGSFSRFAQGVDNDLTSNPSHFVNGHGLQSTPLNASLTDGLQSNAPPHVSPLSSGSQSNARPDHVASISDGLPSDAPLLNTPLDDHVEEAVEDTVQSLH
nr:Transposon, En/Spm-like protein [Ipomoea batatas]